MTLKWSGRAGIFSLTIVLAVGIVSWRMRSNNELQTSVSDGETNFVRTATVQDYISSRRNDSQYDWKMDINVRGKVVDELGNPVSFAKIDYSCNDLTGSQVGVVTSDESGRFGISGLRGKVLSLNASRDGYSPSSGSRMVIEFADPRSSHFLGTNLTKDIVLAIEGKSVKNRIARYRFDFQLTKESPVLFDPIRLNIGALCKLVFRLKSYDDNRYSLSLSNSCGGVIYDFEERLRSEVPVSGFVDELVVGDVMDLVAGPFETTSRVFLSIENGKYYGVVMLYAVFSPASFTSKEALLNVTAHFSINTAGGRMVQYDESLEEFHLDLDRVRLGNRPSITPD